MAKLQLGKSPVNFKQEVSFLRLDGEEVTIEISYKYRTRSQYAELLDEILEPVEQKKSKKDEVLKVAEMLKQQDVSTVEFMLKIADGWDLEDEFNKENLTALLNEFPSAAKAINETYRITILEGRVKN
jgi:hypothetical protein